MAAPSPTVGGKPPTAPPTTGPAGAGVVPYGAPGTTFANGYTVPVPVTSPTFNDGPALASYALANGSDTLDVRPANNWRITRRSDGMELQSGLGTFANAQTTASAMATANEIG